MLDRYLLRYFLAVVDQGNFSRAAIMCNVSQPTLSVGIAKLERTLGHPLFVRSNQRVELTEAGGRFQVHARRIESAFNLAMNEMGLVTDMPSFRLGVLSSVPSVILAEAVAEAKPAQTHRFELVFGSERELIGHLAKGRIDLALTVIERGSDRFRERKVGDESYVLALGLDHPLAGEPKIAPEQLANDAMIVRRHCEALSETSRFFTERGIRPHFALRSTNDERVLDMVAAGLGVTVMPQCYHHARVVRPRLAGFNVRRTLGWIAGHHAEHLLDAPLPLMIAVCARIAR